jgi:hypothetical protein
MLMSSVVVIVTIHIGSRTIVLVFANNLNVLSVKSSLHLPTCLAKVFVYLWQMFLINVLSRYS